MGTCASARSLSARVAGEESEQPPEPAMTVGSDREERVVGPRFQGIRAWYIRDWISEAQTNYNGIRY
jgi:hypothetical protein